MTPTEPLDARTLPTGRTLLGVVLRAWPVVAAWDFTCATGLSMLAYHSTFQRLWQGVAVTVLGPAALKMGAEGVTVGLALHASVALVWTLIFAIAIAGWPALGRAVARPAGAFAVACVYGPFIWLVMSFVVIPLALHRPTPIGFRWWVQFFSHVPFVALPLVFAVRRAYGLAVRFYEAAPSQPRPTDFSGPGAAHTISDFKPN